jgi:isocitrate/isopropylmalate dehydrogenase
MNGVAFDIVGQGKADPEAVLRTLHLLSLPERGQALRLSDHTT